MMLFNNNKISEYKTNFPKERLYNRKRLILQGWKK